MPRILIAECMQEISSFNPLQSGYDHFSVQRGEELYRQATLNSAVGGALAVFRGAPGVTTVPAYSARAGSAGLLSAAGWNRLSEEFVAAVTANLANIDGIYVSLHGAMGADGELDPEGFLLAEVRRLAGPRVPIVISLDLHGILTDRMLRQIDGLTLYHTYPHVDFADTGARAARLLLRLMTQPTRAVIARVVIPALVRGDELITKSGCYGDLIRDCQRIERDGTALAAGIMIGNPFTDVPELCSQVLVMTDDDAARARREALRLAEEFWPQRSCMQGKLISLERAVAQARAMAGPVLFTDAADATSSGAGTLNEQPGQRDFEPLLGRWSFQLKVRLKPLTGSTQWIDYAGGGECTPLWHGRAQLDTINLKGPTKHIECLTVRLFNPKTHEWRLYWANSRDGLVVAPQIGSFKAGHGEFYAQDLLDDKSILVKFDWSGLVSKSPHFEQLFSNDGGKNWEVNWITDQTRVN